jgi:hypothetical protein
VASDEMTKKSHVVVELETESEPSLIRWSTTWGQVELTLAQADHYRSSPGLAFGSRPGYLERHGNYEGLKQSLRPLLEKDIDAICGAHGTPFWDNPKAEIARLIDTL